MVRGLDPRFREPLRAEPVNAATAGKDRATQPRRTADPTDWRLARCLVAPTSTGCAPTRRTAGRAGRRPRRPSVSCGTNRPTAEFPVEPSRDDADASGGAPGRTGDPGNDFPQRHDARGARN
jgi:hypothetical protein